MSLEVSENTSLADAYTLFKASYSKGDFLTPSEVPFVIRLLENPRYSLKLFGNELFPGRTTLEHHDYLHALMGMKGDIQGEAVVIGATMGSTGKMNKLKTFLFVWIENVFTPKKFHYDSAAARKLFYRTVQESTILAKKRILEDLSTFDFENHLVESVGSIRKKLGLDILMNNLEQIQLENFIHLNRDEEKFIDSKTKELYEKRIAPYAPDLSSAKRALIMDFQKKVFIMDHYFEQNRQLDPFVLSATWRELEKNLDGLGIAGELQKNILQDMKDYADIEASLRQGKLLSEYEIGYFYFKKSCDVRMQRHIIRYLNHEPPVSSESEIAKDILEEIEDDIDDIEEDKKVVSNGNRLLEILDAHNVVNVQEYTAFVDSTQNVSRDVVQRIISKLSKIN